MGALENPIVKLLTAFEANQLGVSHHTPAAAPWCLLAHLLLLSMLSTPLLPTLSSASAIMSPTLSSLPAEMDAMFCEVTVTVTAAGAAAAAAAAADG
jgi:hypothetical protein